MVPRAEHELRWKVEDERSAETRKSFESLHRRLDQFSSDTQRWRDQFTTELEARIRGIFEHRIEALEGRSDRAEQARSIAGIPAVTVGIITAVISAVLVILLQHFWPSVPVRP